jgi:hypothetical protein
MQTITSVSGGRTSAYLAANYPADHLLFSLVRIEDERCRFPDEKISREVEDRIQAPFIATAEDDKIIYTMLDLEQYLGQKINWVTGCTYDHLISKINGGYVPNLMWRKCTTYLKLIPMAQWWLANIGEPVIAQIGFRANETERANNTLSQLNDQGLLEIKIPVLSKKTKRGWQNSNKVFAWQRPSFPLIENGIFKPRITNFWKGKPVQFADYNNCVGCFNRSDLFLAKMFDVHPKKMQWHADKEGKTFWKKGMRYEDLKKWKVQQQLSFEDLPGCASGYCEVN